MTEEIKEILNFLKEPFNKEKTHKAIDKKDTTVLLNYITNLQKENMKLISENEAIKNIKYTVDETIYKQRNKKASAFLKHLKNTFDESDEMYDLLNNAIDILQGGDD